MKKVIIFSLVFILISGYAFAHSGDTINVLQGTNPTIDGAISPGEWSDASVITFSGNGITITCYVKHNGSDTLYIAQDIPNLSNGDKAFLWLDTQHNGGSAPQTDDYYIMRYYATGGEIEYAGTSSTWNNVSPSGWSSAFTGTMWTSQPGQMEFAISFNKLGVTAGISKTIGFMAGFGEAPPPETNYWRWPAGTNGYQNPNTWANMILSFTTAITENTIPKNEITVFPNPSSGVFAIQVDSKQSAVNKMELDVYNVMGEKIQQLAVSSKQLADNIPIVIDISSHPSGVYFLRIRTGKGNLNKKIVIQK